MLGHPIPSGNLLAATVVLDDVTLAAFPGAPSHHGIAHRHDCDRGWRGACRIVGQVGPLADGRPIDALAFVRRPLGGGMVPQLPAPSPFHRARRAGGGSRRGVVRGRRRFGHWFWPDRDASWVPGGAPARVVDRRTRFHRHRTGGTSSAAVARPAQLLQRARLASSAQVSLFFRTGSEY
jgi:hypothetical protein